MASKKITAMPDLAGGQVSTDLATLVDLSAAVANQNAKSTLNDLFSIITKNITDGALRFQGTFNPAVSAANQGSFFYNDTTDTFQGSRNVSAYQNLLFGLGGNTRVAIWDTLADSLTGFASFTYVNTTPKALITAANSSGALEVSSSVALTPSSVKLHGGLGLLWLKGFFGSANLSLNTGRSGPAFPLSGSDIGTITFGVTDSSADFANTTLATLGVVTTQNATGATTGVGLQIITADNSAGSTTRFTITGTGAIIVGANGQGVTSTLGGSVTKVVIGTLTTYDANAVIQMANPFVGPTTQKTLVVQANASQSAVVLETQNSAGVFGFQITPGGAISLQGFALAPSLSAAGTAKFYFDTNDNKLKLSENGGAYVNVV